MSLPYFLGSKSELGLTDFAPLAMKAMFSNRKPLTEEEKAAKDTRKKRPKMQIEGLDGGMGNLMELAGMDCHWSIYNIYSMFLKTVSKTNCTYIKLAGGPCSLGWYWHCSLALKSGTVHFPSIYNVICVQNPASKGWSSKFKLSFI